MDKKPEDQIAESLETTPELLPYIPGLLADLWVLGSSIDVIIELIQSLNLPPVSTRVLDAGCGKGAVGITLAQNYGFQLYGIDLYEPFLEEAKMKAEEKGVSDLCHFELGDMHEKLTGDEQFTIVIYASIGGALGSFDECVGKLRKSVSQGGYIIIDDGFLKGKKELKIPGYEHYVSHKKVKKQLTSHGDKLLKEIILPESYIRSINRDYLEHIKKRAEKLIVKQNEISHLIRQYLKRQEHESEIIEKEITGAVWLLQKV